MPAHSLFAWKFYHLTSDLARRGWHILIISEHVVSPVYYQWTNIIIKEIYEYWHYYVPNNIPIYIISKGDLYILLFPIWKFVWWILSSIDSNVVETWSLTTIINIVPFVIYNVWRHGFSCEFPRTNSSLYYCWLIRVPPPPKVKENSIFISLVYNPNWPFGINHMLSHLVRDMLRSYAIRGILGLWKLQDGLYLSLNSSRRLI